MPDTPALKVRDLVVEINGQKILNGISFDVPSGQIAAVIGPNGAGKTILLRSILRQIPITGGEIEIFGVNNRRYRQIAPKISYIPQKLNFDPNLPLTVRGLFSLKSKRLLGMSRLDKQHMDALLKKVGMSKYVGARVNTLSGGQLQRVLIAYSLMDRPKLLLLDEPAAGIDSQGQETIYSLLHRIQQSDKLTMLLVSHELDIVMRYAGQVLCLNQKLFCAGAPRQAMSNDVLEKMYGSPMAHQIHTDHHHH